MKWHVSSWECDYRGRVFRYESAGELHRVVYRGEKRERRRRRMARKRRRGWA